MGKSITELLLEYRTPDHESATMHVRPSLAGICLDKKMIGHYLYPIEHKGMRVVFTGGWTFPGHDPPVFAEVTIRYERSKYFVVVSFTDNIASGVVVGGDIVAYPLIARAGMNKLLTPGTFTLWWERPIDSKLIPC